MEWSFGRVIIAVGGYLRHDTILLLILCGPSAMSVFVSSLPFVVAKERRKRKLLRSPFATCKKLLFCGVSWRTCFVPHFLCYNMLVL